MIAAKLKGGLGSQMFQYAAARALSLEKNTWVYLDPSFLYEDAKGRWTQREYELDCFNIVYKFERSGRINLLRSLNHKVRMRRISESALWPFPYRNFTEQAGGFNTTFFGNPVNTYLEGYFQSEKYFVKYRDNLRKEFTFHEAPSERNAALLNEIKNGTTLSIHVRRGDYVTLSSASVFHGCMNETYYSDSISRMLEMIPEINLCCVFSDDIEWARQHITSAVKTLFVDWNKKGSEDLRLMMNCTHHIIANSSFSWWGAWLSEKEHSKIIAPAKWFADANASDMDIVPERWIRI
jgi:hypothetical protein